MIVVFLDHTHLLFLNIVTVSVLLFMHVNISFKLQVILYMTERKKPLFTQKMTIIMIVLSMSMLIITKQQSGERGQGH